MRTLTKREQEIFDTVKAQRPNCPEQYIREYAIASAGREKYGHDVPKRVNNRLGKILHFIHDNYPTKGEFSIIISF